VFIAGNPIQVSGVEAYPVLSTVYLHQGERIDRLFIVESGYCELVSDFFSDDVLSETMGPGAVFGEVRKFVGWHELCNIFSASFKDNDSNVSFVF